MGNSKIYRDFCEEIKEIQKEKNSIYIINAGRMNGGKSSLFNSLLGEEKFEVKDIRTTVERRDERYSDDVFLTDTPGLCANEQDNIAALNIYKNANMIVFVHSFAIGGLRQEEIEWINKIKHIMSTEEYFWKHFCMVLSYVDELWEGKHFLIDKEEEIRKEVLKNLKEGCGRDSVPIFSVSNNLYVTGREGKNDEMMKLSGIPKLKKFIDKEIPIWKEEAEKVLCDKINRLKSDAIKELNGEKDVLIAKVKGKEAEMRKRLANYKSDLNTFESRIEVERENVKSVSRQFNNAKSTLAQLKRKHQQDKSEY